MKKLILLTVLISQIGCAPVLVGGLIYKGTKTKKARQEFTSHFQKNNTDREVKGLKPLDWCDEVYKFDPKWAAKQSQCFMRK